MESPVNGSCNSDGSKVNTYASLSKTKLYAGKSSHSRWIHTAYFFLPFLAIWPEKYQCIVIKSRTRGQSARNFASKKIVRRLLLSFRRSFLFSQDSSKLLRSIIQRIFRDLTFGCFEKKINYVLRLKQLWNYKHNE